LLPRSIELRRIKDEKLQAQMVLGGGDDYELAFTAPQRSGPR